MKKIISFLIIALITVNSAYSQRLNGVLGGSTKSTARIINVITTDIDSAIEGSPYINENFVPARLSIAPNEVFYMRYNAFNDEIEIKGDNDIIYGLNKDRKDFLVNFSVPKQTYQLFDYVLNNESLLGYFIKLNNDSMLLLLKKERTIYVEEKISENSYNPSKPAKFKRSKDKYFIKIDDKSAIELPKNKKDVAKLFPKFENETLSYIKKNKIKLNNEMDLLKLIEYLNSLNSKKA